MVDVGADPGMGIGISYNDIIAVLDNFTSQITSLGHGGNAGKTEHVGHGGGVVVAEPVAVDKQELIVDVL